MGAAKIPEEIEERRSEGLLMSSEPVVPKAPPTAQELLKKNVEIIRLKAENERLKSGEEVSSLRVLAQRYKNENTLLKKEKTALEKVVLSLKKEILDLRSKLINKSDIQVIAPKKAPPKKKKGALSEYLAKLNFQKNGDPKKRKKK